jgi:hypothetical protein
MYTFKMNLYALMAGGIEWCYEYCTLPFQVWLYIYPIMLAKLCYKFSCKKGYFLELCLVRMCMASLVEK